MSRMKISQPGKIAALAAAFWTTVIGGTLAVHEYIIDPAPPPTGLQSLQSEFTAAIAERVEGVKAEQRDAVLVEKLCGETASMLTARFQGSGLAATFTAPYEPPHASYHLGKCALSVNGTYLTTIQSPDEFESEFNRKYLNEKLVEKLSPAALQHLQKGLNVQP